MKHNLYFLQKSRLYACFILLFVIVLLVNQIGQREEAVGDIHTLYHHVIGYGQVQRNKVQNRLDAQLYNTVSGFLPDLLRHTQDTDVNFVVSDKGVEIIHMVDRHIAHLLANLIWVHIEHGLEMDAFFFKTLVIDNGMTQVPGTDNNAVVLEIKPQNFADGLLQLFYLIAIALLPVSAKGIQVLTDL